MSVRQYIGARYVPKFYENELGTPEWRPNVIYEPLTIVTYSGNSYTSKKEVPAMAGSPDLTPEYWAATGDYNAQVAQIQNDINQLRLDVTQFENDVITKVHSKFVSLQDFGVTGSGDESSKVANAIQYAKANGIDYIISSTDVTLQDITIASDMTFDMMGHTIHGVQYDPNAYRLNRMFTCSASGVNLVFKNTIFQGVTGTTTQSGAKLPYEDYALINVKNAHSVIIDNCIFTDIIASYYDTIGIGFSFIYNCVDCDNVQISNCKFIHCRGEEIGWIRPDSKNKRHLRATLKNNYYEDLNTSTCDALVGMLEVYKNVYNYAYAGSLVNAFSKNVHIHDEEILVAVSGAYDISENDLFYADTCIVENIHCLTNVANFLSGNAGTITIRNIVGFIDRILMMTTGYGGSYVHAETVPISYAAVNIENIYAMTDCIIITAPNNVVSGQVEVKISNSHINNNIRSIRGNKLKVLIDHCWLRTRADSGFGSTPILCYFQSGDAPLSLNMKNCYINNTSGSGNEVLFGGVNGVKYVIIKDNYAETSGSDTAVSGTPTNLVVKDNINITNI